jgi:hypothetical protein
MNSLKEAISNTLDSIHDSVEKVAFQNHLYGCVVVLEQIVEKRGDLSGNMFTDDDGELFNLNDDFDSIGIYYGFIDNTSLGYRSSDAYKREWIKLYSEGSDDIKILDEFEDTIFKELVNKCKDLPYFESSLVSGELNEEWKNKLNELIHEKLQKKARIVYGKTRRARVKRNLTPIHKRVGARKTRRKYRDII